MKKEIHQNTNPSLGQFLKKLKPSERKLWKKLAGKLKSEDPISPEKGKGLYLGGA